MAFWDQIYESVTLICTRPNPGFSHQRKGVQKIQNTFFEQYDYTIVDVWEGRYIGMKRTKFNSICQPTSNVN